MNTHHSSKVPNESHFCLEVGKGRQHNVLGCDGKHSLVSDIPMAGFPNNKEFHYVFSVKEKSILFSRNSSKILTAIQAYISTRVHKYTELHSHNRTFFSNENQVLLYLISFFKSMKDTASHSKDRQNSYCCFLGGKNNLSNIPFNFPWSCTDLCPSFHFINFKMSPLCIH